MFKITNEFIVRGVSRNGGWSKEQLEILGVEWPPIKGWKSRAIGRLISEDEATRFLDLKDAHLTPTKEVDKICHKEDRLWEMCLAIAASKRI